MRISDWSSDVCSSDLVDSGPILEQAFFHVAPDETAASLYARHMRALGEMMPRALAALATGSPPRLEQDERYASWAAKRTPEDGRIDWRQNAIDIDRLIRAAGRPYPGAWSSRSEEHTSELQSLMRISYAVFCLKKKN